MHTPPLFPRSSSTASATSKPALEGDHVAVWNRSLKVDLVREFLTHNQFVVRLCDSVDTQCEEGNCPARQIVLLGLSHPPHVQDETVSIIKSFKRARYHVLCYADHIDAWPLAVRSRLFLAGAVRLFDSIDRGFECKLVAYLRGETEMQARHMEEQHRIDELRQRAGFVAASPAMQAVVRWVVRIGAYSSLPVLITGEPGTGKELIARAVHQLDPLRCDGPFIVVNCGAISSTLAESEFFGHRRGTFTGAERDRQGLVRAADGGVLFLDEIGELPESLQAKLLRVLQEHRVLTIGEEKEVPVNVRVVAATNADLPTLVRQGRFRLDLYGRLNVLPVRLPPLRERCEDIAPLIRHFLEKHRAPGALPPVEVGHDFVDAITRLELKGNARQLENLVRWVMVNKRDNAPLGLQDLPQEVWTRLSQEAELTPPADLAGTWRCDLGNHLLSALNANSWNLARSLNECERQLLEAALQVTSGNQSRMAKLLGITPRCVYNKLRKHRLQP